jgi:uncharacterized phage-associated protein
VPHSSSIPKPVSFRPDRKKIIEALVFLAENKRRIDVFHVCKVLYFAEREHFRKYGRPILGDSYFAMDDGPVPSIALDIAKQTRFVSDEWLKYVKEKLVIDDSDGYVRLAAKDTFDSDVFSRTDIECLTESLSRYGEMPFLELWRLVHNEPAWKEYYAGSGTSTHIPFESLLPKSMKHREKAIEQLREVASVIEL